MVSFGSLNFNSIGVPTVGVSAHDIVDVYDNVMEKKNNYIAVTLANDNNSKKRAGAAVIGANAGLLQMALLTGIYGIAKTNPKYNYPIIDKFITKKFDKWIERARQNRPNAGTFQHVLTGLSAKAGWAALTGAAIAYAFDWYATARNTIVNGRISNTKSGVEGSWITSGLKSLSASDEGKEIIRNSIRKNRDKSVTVRFEGLDREYTITKKELKDASRAYVTYTNDEGKVTAFKKKFSKGDGDALAFEVAYEKYCNEVLEGKVKFDKNLSGSVEKITEQGDILFTNGSVNHLYYLLTGKQTSEYSKENTGDNIMDMYSKASIQQFIKENSKNPDKYAAEIKLNEGVNGKLAVRDKFYQIHNLNTDKNYIITKVNAKYVTIANSEKTRETIDIPVSKLNNYVASVSYVNLNND